MPHLLLVDDNADHLFLTRRALRSAGIDSTGFETAESALDALRARQFDMIVVDHNLPGMKGAELISRIRALDIDTPVVMVTGGGSEQLAVDALKAGALDYIVKTDGYLTSLPPRIRRALAQHELEQANRQLEREREEAIAKASEHARRLRDLQQASLRINSSLQPRDVRTQAVNLAASLLDADMAAFFLLNEDGLSLRIVASRGLSVSYADTIRVPVGDGAVGWAVLHGEPAIVADVQADERTAAYVSTAKREGYRSILAAPLLMRGDVQGAITVYDQSGRTWEAEEVVLLQALAQNVAVAYENAQLYDRLATRVTELQTLNRIVTSLTISTDLQSALDSAVEHLAQLFSAAGGAIALKDSHSESYRIYGASSLSDSLRTALQTLHAMEDENPDEVPVSPDLRAIYERKLQFIPDITSDPHMQDFWETARVLEWRSVVSVPLIPSDEPIGALTLFFNRRRRIDRQERQILETVSNAVAVAVQRAVLQERLLQKEAQRLALAESSRLKTEFISTVSHELRTPLTSIEGYVNVILRGHCGEVPPLQAEFLEIVARNSLRLSNLVNDLLDISKIESGELNLDRQRVDLAKVVSDCVRMISPQAQAHQMHIRLRVSESVPPVMGDSERLGEVVTNLLSNAIKYSPDSAPIEVEVGDRNEDGQRGVVVSVRDHGIGITADDIPNLFRKFYRVDNSSTRTVGGTGLGLSISRHLVELHGGRIWVESEPRKGSAFHFSVPAAESPGETGSPVPIAPVSSSSTSGVEHAQDHGSG